jgi:lipoic acid synthetase
VRHGDPKTLEPDEPRRVAEAIAELGLNYIVITSVTRDDLPDGGAAQFAATVRAVRNTSPRTKIELLVPDFKGNKDALAVIKAEPPDVIGHNIETVRSLFPKVRPQGDFVRSLDLLAAFKQIMPEVLVKSGFMAGMGESREEITAVMNELKDAGCDMITVGQYLSPSRTERHWPVARFLTPEEFRSIKEEAEAIGFKSVESGPLVRSSYLAEKGYIKAVG